MQWIDPEDPRQLERFQTDFQASRDKLRPYRKDLKAAWVQFAGSNWGARKSGDYAHSPINRVEAAVSTYLRHLAASGPQVSILTRHPSLKPLSMDAETILNKRFRELDFEECIHEWVRNAILGIGILKACWAPDPDFVWQAPDGEQVDIGKFQAEVVSLGDWCHDMRAKRLQDSTFFAHCFELTRKEALARPDWDSTVVKQMDSGRDLSDSDQETLHSLGYGTYNDDERFAESLKFWEVYFPKAGIVVTLPGGTDWRRPVNTRDYIGPRNRGFGPYHFLFFETVESNTMPVPPVSLWMDLHKLINQLWRKTARQAGNQKQFLLYPIGADEDAAMIAKVQDQGSVGVNDPAAAQVVSLGGADQSVLLVLGQAMDAFNTSSGNVDLLAGTSPQSETARQDQMLSESANVRLGAMRDAIYKATRIVCESAAWYYWHDPVRTYEDVRAIPNTDLWVPITITPEMRANNWADFNFTIVPHSMQELTPKQREEMLKQLLQTFIMPAMQFMAQQGLTVNFEKVLGLLAKYSNFPELAEIVDFVDPETMAGPIGGRDGAGKPPVTTRNVVRSNLSGGGTDRSRRNSLAQVLAGGQPNQDQMGQLAAGMGGGR